MTTLNKPRITELLALDRERTQGDWRAHEVLLGVYASGGCVADAETPRDAIKRRENMRFIACAPELAEQLRLAVEEVERLETSTQELARALFNLYEHDAEYIRINKLGHPNHNAVMLAAHAALESKP